MLRIPFTLADTKIALTSNGTVVRDENGDPVVGHWASDANSNVINFDINGTSNTADCGYTFNERNQLVLQLQNDQGILIDGITVPGMIHVLSDTRITYTAIDDTGALTSDVFNIAGTLSFDHDNHLVVTFADESTAEITGASDSPILALRNIHDDESAADLLRFSAQTVNTTSAGDALSVPAIIDIPGSWNIQDGTIVFQAAGGTDPAKPLTIGFAGKFKGISAGFVYTPANGGTFVISGSHIWNSNSASWDVVLGFSASKFTAHVDVDAKLSGGLTIAGKLNIEQGQNKPASFDLELKIQKTFNTAGMITFVADVGSTNNHLAYDFKLTGTYAFDGFALTFAAEVNNDGATVSLAIANKNNPNALSVSLKAVLSGTSHSFSLSVSFTLAVTFKDGKLVKSNPKPLPQPSQKAKALSQGTSSAAD